MVSRRRLGSLPPRLRRLFFEFPSPFVVGFAGTPWRVVEAAARGCAGPWLAAPKTATILMLDVCLRNLGG